MVSQPDSESPAPLTRRRERPNIIPGLRHGDNHSPWLSLEEGANPVGYHPTNSNIQVAFFPSHLSHSFFLSLFSRYPIPFPFFPSFLPSFSFLPFLPFLPSFLPSYLPTFLSFLFPVPFSFSISFFIPFSNMENPDTPPIKIARYIYHAGVTFEVFRPEELPGIPIFGDPKQRRNNSSSSNSSNKKRGVDEEEQGWEKRRRSE